MTTVTTPVLATLELTRRKQTITADYLSAGDSVVEATGTSRVRVLNFESAKHSIEARVNSGAWTVIEERDSGTFDINLATDTLRLRRALNAPASMVVDLEIFSLPASTLTTPGGQALNPVSGAGNSALAVFNAAVAARETKAVIALGFQDSWGEYRTVSAFGKQYTQLLPAQWRGAKPVSGIGAKGGIGYVPIRNVSIFAPYANPWVLAGTTTLNSGSGGMGLRYTLFTNSSDKATITVTGTSCILHYLKAASSRVGYYKVDGGAAVTFETNNGAVSDDGFLTINFGASGSHTLEVGWFSGGQVYLAGAEFFDGDENKGFRFLEGGHTGYRTTDYIAGAPGADALHTRVAAIAPHLIIIALGQNDFAQSAGLFISAAQYKANLKSLIASLRAKGVTASFLLVLSADVTAIKDGGQTSTWAQFQSAAKEVAWEDTGNNGATGVAVVSLTDTGLIPPSTGSAGGLWIDGSHVGDTGHLIIANTIFGALIS